MDKNDSKRLKELRQELIDLDAKRVEAEGNKRAVGAERLRLKAKLEADFKDSVDMFKMNELVEAGGNVLDRGLKAKVFDRNTNLEQAVKRIEGVFLAVGQHLNELTVKRKALVKEISVLEGKSTVENLKQAHAGLVAAIAAAEKAYGDYHRLMANIPPNAVDLAKRAGLTDPFFIASISRLGKPGDNLLAWIGWASGLSQAGNPLYGSKRETGESGFKRGGLYHGPNAHFQNN